MTGQTNAVINFKSCNGITPGQMLIINQFVRRGVNLVSIDIEASAHTMYGCPAPSIDNVSLVVFGDIHEIKALGKMLRGESSGHFPLDYEVQKVVESSWT